MSNANELPGAEVLDVQPPSADPVQAAARGTGLARRRRVAGAQEPNPCGEPTKAGGTCRTPRLTGRTRCRFHEAKHDPTLGALVASDRQRGGAARVLREFGLALEIDMGDPASIRQALAEAAKAVAAGRIPASTAGAISQLVNSGLRVAELEVSARIAALQAQLDRYAEERGGRR